MTKVQKSNSTKVQKSEKAGENMNCSLSINYHLLFNLSFRLGRNLSSFLASYTCIQKDSRLSYPHRIRSTVDESPGATRGQGCLAKVQKDKREEVQKTRREEVLFIIKPLKIVLRKGKIIMAQKDSRGPSEMGYLKPYHP